MRQLIILVIPFLLQAADRLVTAATAATDELKSGTLVKTTKN